MVASTPSSEGSLQLVWGLMGVFSRQASWEVVRSLCQSPEQQDIL